MMEREGLSPRTESVLIHMKGLELNRVVWGKSHSYSIYFVIMIFFELSHVPQPCLELSM